MNHGSLFSGIGGFDLAAEWAGWTNVFHCEWNPFGQKVLKHYWPNAESFNDITKTDFTPYANKIDILTGGFPCQPYSSAGKRKGKEDERHLWPEMLRAIREISPRWIVGENVLGLVNWSGGLVFHEVQADLEAAGYEVQPFLLPAAAVGAPHRRDRCWFVANTKDRNAIGTREINNTRWEDNTKVGAGLWDKFGSNGTKINATNTESKSSEWLRFEQREFGQQKQGKFRGNNSEMGNGDAADTDSNGQHKRNSNDEINASERRINALCNIEQSIVDGNATNTRLQRQEKCEKQTTRVEQCGEERDATDTRKPPTEYWRNFPTQSPICSGDDGLPTELDGITFSKWRKESIMGYGNAVCPQLVYQIFKAINEYE